MSYLFGFRFRDSPAIGLIHPDGCVLLDFFDFWGIYSQLLSMRSLLSVLLMTNLPSQVFYLWHLNWVRDIFLYLNNSTWCWVWYCAWPRYVAHLMNPWNVAPMVYKTFSFLLGLECGTDSLTACSIYAFGQTVILIHNS